MTYREIYMSERERTREMYQTSHFTVARRLNKFPIAGKLTRATTTNIRNILSFSAKKNNKEIKYEEIISHPWKHIENLQTAIKIFYKKFGNPVFEEYNRCLKMLKKSTYLLTFSCLIHLQWNKCMYLFIVLFCWFSLISYLYRYFILVCFV